MPVPTSPSTYHSAAPTAASPSVARKAAIPGTANCRANDARENAVKPSIPWRRTS
jgi:hypothetical protein